MVLVSGSRTVSRLMSISSISRVGRRLILAEPESRRRSCVKAGGPDRVQQRIPVEGFLKERDRAGLERPLARLLVAASLQNDHGDARARGREMPEEVEAAHAGHPQIEHQATGVLWLSGSQELLRRGERVDSEADRQQQIPEGPTQR